MSGIVIVGSGFAGASTALELRKHNYTGPITVIGAETEMPYNRPPLSKTYLKSGGEFDTVLVRPSNVWADGNIDLMTGTAVVRIDRANKEVVLDSGPNVPYTALVLATGARSRVLEAIPGSLGLRTWSDAVAVRERFWRDQDLVVVGGGFIGLELASAAAEAGVNIAIVESAERLLARALSSETAEFLLDEHRRHGVDVRLGSTVRESKSGTVTLDSGDVLRADTVLVGIGVFPETELAREAGLAIGNGIAVDEYLRTADPDIYAVGDCSWHPCATSGRRVRLESIQNATDQARHVAQTLTGTTTDHYSSVPWFWTEQYGRKVLIAGVAEGSETSVVRGDISGGAFSVCRFSADGRMTAVESVGRIQDHVGARKLLAGHRGGAPVSMDDAADVAKPLAAMSV